ncbi:exonuclease domain-containing protein [uncultured Clostridium sp.]|uniref:exonuclease domain-containing protein n=1 Tax=uncultured Clostridium sp. TaxID=59620 RepID=UPI0026398BDF|nr:exonuclease domain-containing protein [uncultured Clostridium sp.]
MKIAFLDLEFTRKPYDSTFINEIIEMSCISSQIEDEYTLNNDGYIVSEYKLSDKKSDKFTTLVKPTINTFLTKEIVEYTGINQRELDNTGIHLEEAINNLYTYIRKNDIVRIYIYARYSKDLLTSAKRILRGRLDKKIDYIINLLKDINYYSNTARERLVRSISNVSNFEVQFSKETLINKKKFSLNDTYLVLMNKKEVSAKSKVKSVSDAMIIKDVFFSDEKNINDELNEIAYRIELKREKLHSIVLGKKDIIDWICSSTSVEDLKKYKTESLENVMKSIIYIIKEFKHKIGTKSEISVSSINKNDKWLYIYTNVLATARDIQSVYGLKVKSVKDCIDIMLEKEKEVEAKELDANATSILMESGDDFEKFKEQVSNKSEKMINLLISKCKDILKDYEHGHAFKVYTTKLGILNGILAK